MRRLGKVGFLAALAVVCMSSTTTAQDARDRALREEVERRFDVLPLRDGIVLRPRDTALGVRSIEITAGAVALDGQPATGAELRTRLGDAAEPVLRLSYLDDGERRQLFAVPPATRPAAPAETSSPTLSTSPPPDTPATPRTTRRSRDRRGDRVRIGGSVSVSSGETVDGDVVAVGGSVQVDGTVRGDVVSVGGSITLGPQADVDGDVTVVGGVLRRDPAARVGGHAQEVGLGVDLSNWSWRRNPVGTWTRSMFGSAVAFVGVVARVGVLCLLAALVVLFGRNYMERAGAIAANEALKAGAVGLLAQLLFIPLLVVTIVVLVITIIGIPLLLLVPFLILAVAVFGVVGFSAVANRVGGLASRRFGWSEENPYTVTIVGVVLLMLPVILARLVGLGGGMLFPLTLALGIIGFVVEYIAWTVGLGAVALARFNRPRADAGRLEPATGVTGA
ncbi:MAG: hypothetical protein AB7Q29_00330 [Vicinamibacterales bacterium]